MLRFGVTGNGQRRFRVAVVPDNRPSVPVHTDPSGGYFFSDSVGQTPSTPDPA